jgi:hypothetical protein
MKRLQAINESLLGRFHRDRKRAQSASRGQPHVCLVEIQALAVRLVEDCSRRQVEALFAVLTDAYGDLPETAIDWMRTQADAQIRRLAGALQEQLYALRVQLDVWSNDLTDVPKALAEEELRRERQLGDLFGANPMSGGG